MSLIIDRLAFQRKHAQGRVINIGCSGNPAGLAADLHTDIRPGPFIDGPTPEPFLQCEARHIPMPDGSFDTAVMGEILEHFATEAEAKEALVEARRLAKNLVVTVPRDDRMLAKDKWADDVKAPEGQAHVLWISADRLWRMLYDTGWDVQVWLQINYGWSPCGWAVWATRRNVKSDNAAEAEYQARLSEHIPYGGTP